MLRIGAAGCWPDGWSNSWAVAEVTTEPVQVHGGAELLHSCRHQRRAAVQRFCDGVAKSLDFGPTMMVVVSIERASVNQW